MPRLVRLSFLGIALLLFVLAILEVGLRVAGVDLYPRTSILTYQEVYPPALHLDRRPDGAVIRRPRDPRIHWTAVPARKEAGALRVACFGASAVAGLGYSPNVTFPRQLEDLLREAYPGRTIEVLNLGVVATAAKQIRILFEDTLRYVEADAAVLWCGSNEYLSVHAEKFAELDAKWTERALRALAKLYLYRAVLRAVQGPPSPADLPDRDETQSQDERLTQSKIIERIAITAADCEATMAAFQRELEGIVAAARAARVPLLLCGEGVNDEWVGREGLPEGWMTQLPGSPTTPNEAIAVLDATLARADLAPLARWEALVRRATAKDLAGDSDGARIDWRAACNADPHQRRSTDAHRAAARRAAVGDGVAYLDGDAVLRADHPSGRIGFDYFYDYTHLSPRGAAVVATAVFDALQSLPGVPRATAPLERGADGLPTVLANRLARIATATVDFADAKEFIGFCFDPRELGSTDLWKYDNAVRALDARIDSQPGDWRARAFRGNARSYLSTFGSGEAARGDWEAALAACDDSDAAEAIRANLARLMLWRPAGR